MKYLTTAILVSALLAAGSRASAADMADPFAKSPLEAKIARLKVEAKCNAALAKRKAAYAAALAEVARFAIKGKAFDKARSIIVLITPLDAKLAKKLTEQIVTAEHPIVGRWLFNRVTGGQSIITCWPSGQARSTDVAKPGTWSRRPDGKYNVLSWTVRVTGNRCVALRRVGANVQKANGVRVGSQPKKRETVQAKIVDPRSLIH